MKSESLGDLATRLGYAERTPGNDPQLSLYEDGSLWPSGEMEHSCQGCADPSRIVALLMYVCKVHGVIQPGCHKTGTGTRTWVETTCGKRAPEPPELSVRFH